ncbi:hypothetical protein R1sor_023600 [Riccia sorocarpa]|uniref:Uncharacterized protein n=1 Tax=Riccia sorocarpa TaxID=122646 RepID=A0ABD3GU28_9MARC
MKTALLSSRPTGSSSVGNGEKFEYAGPDEAGRARRSGVRKEKRRKKGRNGGGGQRVGKKSAREGRRRETGV